MSVVELQDIADNVRATHDGDGWLFTASVYGGDGVYAGMVHVLDRDFLLAATKLICEAKRMREAAR